MCRAQAGARGAHAVPMSGCEWDVPGGEHGENVGLRRAGGSSNGFEGQIPSPSALALPGVGAGWAARQAAKKPRRNLTFPE